MPGEVSCKVSSPMVGLTISLIFPRNLHVSKHVIIKVVHWTVVLWWILNFQEDYIRFIKIIKWKLAE